jgi:hypothetical protein
MLTNCTVPDPDFIEPTTSATLPSGESEMSDPLSEEGAESGTSVSEASGASDETDSADASTLDSAAETSANSSENTSGVDSSEGSAANMSSEPGDLGCKSSVACLAYNASAPVDSSLTFDGRRRAVRIDFSAIDNAAKISQIYVYTGGVSNTMYLGLWSDTTPSGIPDAEIVSASFTLGIPLAWQGLGLVTPLEASIFTDTVWLVFSGGDGAQLPVATGGDKLVSLRERNGDGWLTLADAAYMIDIECCI